MRGCRYTAPPLTSTVSVVDRFHQLHYITSIILAKALFITRLVPFAERQIIIMIKYSVIVPFHSNSNLFSVCISSLEKALDPSKSEIIVVDNNSHGSQIPSDLNIQKRCKVISIKENLMYPRAINLGAENAKGEFLIFCDADTCVTKGFEIGLTDALNDGSVGYSSAKLLNMYTNCIQEFGIASSYYNFPHPYAGRPADFELTSKEHSPLAGCEIGRAHV